MLAVRLTAGTSSQVKVSVPSPWELQYTTASLQATKLAGAAVTRMLLDAVTLATDTVWVLPLQPEALSVAVVETAF